MKPKNKFHEQVVEASKSLPRLTQVQIQCGYDNVIEHIGRRTNKGKITCTKCAHSWQGHGELISSLCEHTCPNCKADLKILTTKKQVFNGNYYMTVITAHKGYQVLRTLMIKCTAKVGKLPEYSHSEVMQRWIAPSGKYCTFARLRQSMGTCYYDLWLFHTPLELRNENSNNKYSINVYDRINTGEIYPRVKLIPELKRTGLKKEFYEQKPLNLFRLLLTDSRAETLMKTGNTKLLKRIIDSGWTLSIDSYWASIKIAVRNKYKIKDAILWLDYIDMLRSCGKDLHNAKYVCPTNLKAEHDRYMRKKAKADAQLEIEKQLLKEDDYRKAKEKFFGISFSDGLISIRVLESVAEIVAEGRSLKHCVSSYHSKADSLILSACIDGQRVETVEVSISKLKVVQARGLCNQNTEYHNQIIELVEQNISLIENRLTA